MKTTAIVDLICAVFTCVLYARHFSSRNISKSNRVLNLCLVLMLLSLVIDAMAYSFIGPAYPMAFRYFLNLLSFLATCVNMIAFTYYTEALFLEKAAPKKWLFRILKGIEFMWLLATAYEYIAGHLIVYENGIENLDYAFSTYVVVIEMVILIYLPVITIINSRKIGKKMTVLLCIFDLAPIITSLLYTEAGIDFAYAFGAITLGLVVEFVQKEQTQILKREQTEAEELANQQRYFKSFGDMVNAALWSMDIDSSNQVIQVFWSNEARRMLGFAESEEDFPNKIDAWTERLCTEDRERVLEHFHNSLKSRDTENFVYDTQYRLRRKTGEYCWYRSVGRMEENADGTRKLYGIVFDISAEKKLEEQTEQLSAALETARLQTKQNDLIAGIINGGRFSYEISADDEITAAHYSELSARRIGKEFCNRMDWIELLEKEDRERVFNGFMSAVRDHTGNTPYNETFRMLGTNGKYRWVRSGGNVLRHADGTGELYGISVDITDQMEEQQERVRAKQMENELVISKLRADSLAFIEDNEPDLDIALDFFGRRILEISGCDQVVYRELDGRRIVLNAPGIEDVPKEICDRCPFASFECKAFGEEGEVLMNDCTKGYRGVMAPADCPAKSSFMQMIYTGGEKVGKLTVHFLNDYHEFTEDNIDIMKTVATYLGLLIGRVNEKKAEIARIEAESANRAKTEFLFSMSHDIRTPMNAILGYTDIGLRHVEDVEKSRESYLKIKSAGGHLLNLINDILEMSRIESGRIELAEDPVDVRIASKNIAYMSHALAESKNIEMTIEIGELKNPYLYTDELHISEVIINLISNAVKYTPEGGRVTYAVNQISGVINGKVTYRFEVTDNGIGMSEDFQRHLFEAFSREQTSTVSKIEGTGLGLSIVKKIVDISGGNIRVKSKQKEGSTFTVEIPFKVMDEAAIERFRAERKAEDENTEEFALEGKKVLLVEDNEMNREIATEMLADAGLIVETAENGEIALKTIIHKGVFYYDFVLMDIQMPVMNGYEATKAIRALPNGNRIPIIALSANAFEEDRKKSLAEGMNAHIAKPIDVKNLFETLHSVAQKQ